MNKILLAFTILFSFQLNAQKDNTISEVRKNNYQVELGFRSIKSIYDNTSSATILFKKKLQSGDLVALNSLKYLRVYLSVNTQINFDEDPTRMDQDSSGTRLHPADIIDLTFGIGIEKQFQNKNFVHYIGTDLFGQFFKSDDDFPGNAVIGGVVSNSTFTTDRTIRSVNAGINPFFGIKYYITKQFNVGIESGFRLTYFNTRFQEVRLLNNGGFGQPVTTFEELEQVTSNGFRFNFLGVRFITLGYSF